MVWGVRGVWGVGVGGVGQGRGGGEGGFTAGLTAAVYIHLCL